MTEITIFLFLLLAMVIYQIFITITVVKEGSVRNWMILIIPALLMVNVLAYKNLHVIMGQPTEKSVGQKFTFLDYLAEEPFIYIWMVEGGKDYPITVKIPYSEKQHEELEKAKQKKGSGVPVTGTLEKSTESVGGETKDANTFVPTTTLPHFQGYTKDGK